MNVFKRWGSHRKYFQISPILKRICEITVPQLFTLDLGLRDCDFVIFVRLGPNWKLIELNCVRFFGARHIFPKNNID